MQGVIIFKGKYGATMQYAGWLANTLDIQAVGADNFHKEQLTNAEYVIIGTSIYIGKFQIRDWLKKNQQLLSGKKIFMFIVSGTDPNKKDKLDTYFRSNVPKELQDKCRHYFLPGKLQFSKLYWTDKLLLKMGARLSRNSNDKIVVQDYNEVKREHLTPLVNAVRSYIDSAQKVPL